MSPGLGCCGARSAGGGAAGSASAQLGTRSCLTTKQMLGILSAASRGTLIGTQRSRGNSHDRHRRTTRTVNAAIAEGLEQTTGIKLAATEVLKSITSVLVPLSVFMLPNSEKLIPAIDTVVDRNFDIVTKFVESQYEFGIAALNLVGSAASN